VKSAAPSSHVLDVRSDVDVNCSSGYRFSVAASMLSRGGLQDVYNVIGGLAARDAERLPVGGREAPTTD
jgi:rhodanese-related sulfurtransferase